LRLEGGSAGGAGGDPREATLVELAVMLAIPHGTEARRWRAAALQAR